MKIKNKKDDTNYLKKKLENAEEIKIVGIVKPSKEWTGGENNLGGVDIDKPSDINIYAKDFEAKEQIKNIIEDYNKKQEDAGNTENAINYSDWVGMLMSSVTNIIDIISYALIAFVSISLVVSSIMIGIITYISVLERTKEIGILRAIGASKKDPVESLRSE